MSYSYSLSLPKNYQSKHWISHKKKRCIESIESFSENTYSRKSFFNPNIQYTITFSNNKSNIELFNYKPNDIETTWFQEKSTSILDIHHHYSIINKQFKKIQPLLTLSRQNLSIPIPRHFSLYEGIIHTILFQFVSTSSAKSSLNRFFNDVLNKDSSPTSLQEHFILSPKHIDTKRLNNIDYLGSGKKNAIIEVTKLFSKQPDIEEKKLSFDDIKQLLLPIKGIGIWTCVNTAMFCTNDFNVTIEKDLVIDKWLKQHNIHQDDIRDIITPYSSYFAKYIWFAVSQDNKE